MLWKNKKASGSKPPARKETIPSIIAKDMNILGNLISDGNIDFNGNIQGNIRCHTLTVRPDANIIGDVTAENVLVYGKVKGLIRVKNAEFYASCHVDGVIMHETLTIEDGAFVDGKFKRTVDKIQVEAEDEEEENSDSFGFDDSSSSSSLRPFDTIRLIR